MKKLPHYKNKWFVGSKIQIDLIIYIVSMCLLSQLLVISYDLAEENMIKEPYAQYLILLIKIAYFGCLAYGFLLTNRIAGPLARLKTHMDAVAEGTIEPEVHFRKHDYSLELVDSFNRLVEKRLINDQGKNKSQET